VDEYTVSAGDPNVADAGSRRQILFIDQPFSNHNGGWIGFGPHDGLLYLGLGDGGGGGDDDTGHGSIGNGQATANLLGAILRIDIDVPADEPGVLWAGTLPGALFRSDARGESWQLNDALWHDPRRQEWWGGGYDGVSQDIYLHGIRVLKGEEEGRTYCCGLTLEVFVKAYSRWVEEHGPIRGDAALLEPERLATMKGAAD